MADPIKMGSMREQAALYQQIQEWLQMEGRIRDLTKQVEEATVAEAMATSKLAAAEARIAELQANVTDTATLRAQLQAAQDSLAGERQARAEADRRTSEMAARLKDQPAITVQPAAVTLPGAGKGLAAAGWDVVINRDGADNMRGFSITPKKG